MAEGRQAEVEQDRAAEVPGAARGVTGRAILFGLCLTVCVSLLSCTVRYVMKGSYMTFCNMPMGNLIPFLLSVIGCAALARGFGRRFVLSSAEWITVFCMGFISAYGPAYGGTGYMISLMAAPYYFATPENGWREYLHPHLPTWLVPTNEHGAMTWFFEGLPAGASIPWGVWVLPLFWWLLFLCAMALLCICASAILHRQWADHERLVYPVIAPAVEMTTRAGTGAWWLPEFMQGKAFWAGFSLTAFVFGWNMISWFYPNVPVFPTAEGTWFWLPRRYPPLWIFLSTFVICFSYFASLEVLFSLWFFDLLFILQGGALNRLGMGATSPHYAMGSFKWQTTGAFVTLTLWGLWVARGHLREVFRKALHPESTHIDDSREMIPYRWAFAGLAGSALFLALWLAQAGMEAKVIALVIPGMVVIYLGLTKILADSGLVYLNPPTSAWETSLAVFGGAGALRASSHVAFGLSSFAISNYRGFLMTPMAHVHRLADLVPGDKRRLFWGVCAAFVTGTVVSTFYTIWLGYTMGAYNFQPNWLVINVGRAYFDAVVVPSIRNPLPVNPTDYGFCLAGAGGMLVLNLMRYRFPWWPFHPVGFALSGMSLTRLTSTTIFLAWLIKYLMIKVAGASFYRRSKPFFIGMLTGYVLAVAAGIAVDSVWFPRQGHEVHKWY